MRVSTGPSRNKGAKTFYLLGSDYIWPRTSNKIARKHIDKLGLKVVGEEYYPLGHTQFNSVINKIKLKKAGRNLRLGCWWLQRGLLQADESRRC